MDLNILPPDDQTFIKKKEVSTRQKLHLQKCRELSKLKLQQQREIEKKKPIC